jgi:hypothetical protein
MMDLRGHTSTNAAKDDIRDAVNNICNGVIPFARSKTGNKVAHDREHEKAVAASDQLSIAFI